MCFSLTLVPIYDIVVIGISGDFRQRPSKRLGRQKTPAIKQDATLSFDKSYENNLGWTTFTSAEQNSEQGFDLRLLVGSGGVKDLHNGVADRFSTTAGLLVTQEFANDETQLSSLEGYLGLDYKKYRYFSPKIDLTISARFYPSLTEKDRYRSTFNGNMRFEIFKDFFFSFQGYITYDTKPVDTNAANSDWGIVTGISYEI